jgi:uncharacterized membrane protein YfcA
MFEPWKLAVLFGTGLGAGFVDAIAGGGGLISIPVLLSLGLDPQQALATNKLQATFGSGSATWHYTEAGTVRFGNCARGFFFSLLGAALGALAVQRIDPYFLKRAIPVLLLAVAIYVIFRPQLGNQDLRPRMSQTAFEVLFGLGLGFYDGFFGPGTGTFWAIACVMLLGYNLTRATGYAKLMNFASNLSSLCFFLLGGKVLFGAGLVMGFGQLIGARLGSRMVIRRGTRLIRPVFLTVVLALTLKLLWGAYKPG